MRGAAGAKTAPSVSRSRALAALLAMSHDTLAFARRATGALLLTLALTAAAVSCTGRLETVLAPSGDAGPPPSPPAVGDASPADPPDVGVLGDPPRGCGAGSDAGVPPDPPDVFVPDEPDPWDAGPPPAPVDSGLWGPLDAGPEPEPPISP